MFDNDAIEIEPALRNRLPGWTEITGYLHDLRAGGRATAAQLLRAARKSGQPIVQPRCGVGSHQEMLGLLRYLELEGDPGLLSVTIDSHTRLRRFRTAERGMRENPERLNGYPLVAHGWQRGRELTEAVRTPLEVRHGSPDGRDLFAFTIASGITSFEGGGISYNLPYSKDVPPAESLRAWQQVDAVCGRLAADGIVVEREMFGTLTAVLVPPSISLAIGLVETRLAAEQGVRCVSISYPQGGQVHQDVAALRAIPALAGRYLPPSVAVHPVLHQFMGVFPKERAKADALILYGALAGRLGAASKIITKTYQEAHGIPSAAANAAGLRTAAIARSDLLSFVALDEARVAEEQHWIEREVAEIVEPLLAAPELATAVAAALADGTLDVPYSASVHARADIVPMRDPDGAIRYWSPGGLPFSPGTTRRNDSLLDGPGGRADLPLDRIIGDINYFSRTG